MPAFEFQAGILAGSKELKIYRDADASGIWFGTTHTLFANREHLYQSGAPVSYAGGAVFLGYLLRSVSDRFLIVLAIFVLLVILAFVRRRSVGIGRSRRRHRLR